MQDCKHCKCNDCKRQYQCPYYNKEDRRYHCNIEEAKNKSKTFCTSSCPGYEKE